MNTHSSTATSSAALMLDAASLDFGGAGVFDLSFGLPAGSILGISVLD